jgi:hypothetical protein
MSEATIAKPATVAGVSESIKVLGEWLSQGTYKLEHTIEDYPIGRRDRGKCKLGFECKRGEWRTVKTTTDKNGRWCNPKRSTYSDDVICVVEHPTLGDKEAAWLMIGFYGASITFANGGHQRLASAPCSSPPRRSPHKYNVTHSVPLTLLEIMAGKKPVVDRIEECELPADPPELCDAFDLWINEITQIRKMVCTVLIELAKAKTTTDKKGR